MGILLGKRSIKVTEEPKAWRPWVVTLPGGAVLRRFSLKGAIDLVDRYLYDHRMDLHGVPEVHFYPATNSGARNSEPIWRKTAGPVWSL
jgi:hypothetical protein